jgi:hypothetical protein
MQQPPFAEYTPKVYTFTKSNGMKTLSLKLDDHTFEEAESITAQLNIARNRYIKESALTRKESMNILREFEKLADED